MPNKVNLRKWVKALRSGKWKQSRLGTCVNKRKAEFYGVPTGYCCLGVANSVCRMDTGRHDTGDAAILSYVTMKWLGIDSPNPRINGTHATTRNDLLRESFSIIADAIEKEYGL